MLSSGGQELAKLSGNDGNPDLSRYWEGRAARVRFVSDGGTSQDGWELHRTGAACTVCPASTLNEVGSGSRSVIDK